MEDGGEGMAAGAISADAAGPSLDSTGFYWVASEVMSKTWRQTETESDT